jgi:predicted CXXCH cytochrome family protein
MRQFRTLLVLAAALVLASFGNVYAFHSGGVAECGGCHSMHSPDPAGTHLLIGPDGSSTCLSCHQQAGLLTPSSYHVSTASADMPAGTAPRQRTPGGDFGWLKKTYTFTVRSATTTEAGQTHGHNIIAAGASYGYVADTDNPTAPGGSYPDAQLGCASCHNPHGKYRRLPNGTISPSGGPIVSSGSYNNSADPGVGQAVGVYRLLNGAGYTTDGVTFAGVPSAVAPSTYNQSEATNMVRVAYGTISTSGHENWGTWCATCHGDMHSDGGNYVHPVDTTLSGIAGTYDSYVKSGDLTGTHATAFQSLVPFAKGSTVTDYAGLRALSSNTNAVLDGPVGSDQVTCLSCHRAHASGFPEMLRWNMEGEFMTYNGQYPGTDTTPTVPQFSRGRLGAEMLAAYYDQPATKWASYQRVLCNKCHAQD